MSRYDEPIVGKFIVSDWSNIKGLPDTLTQGMVKYVRLSLNSKFGSLAATLKLVRSPEFMSNQVVTANGNVIIDKDRFGYWGNSLGGILGGGYVAQSPDIKRGVLGKHIYNFLEIDQE